MVDLPSSRFVDLERDGEFRMHYVEQGARHDQPVVLLHGWPDSSFSFSRVLPLLPESLRCLAVDQRGFGDSGRPEAGYSISEMASDVISFLDALEIGQTALVGHSFGSFVARQVAIMEPGRLTALILIGTGFTPVNPVTREVQAGLRDLADPIPEDFVHDFQSSTIYRPVPPEFFRQIIAESLKLPPRLWRMTFEQLLTHDDSRQLVQIEVPTLLLWGDRDAIFSRDDQERLLHALSHVRLEVYEETGHCPNWEQPDRVAVDIARHALSPRSEPS